MTSRSTSRGSDRTSIWSRIPTILSRTPKPLWYIFGIVTSSYFLTTFLISKISDVHSRITSESATKDGLKKGFQQNQEDVGFTVSALLPMLGKGLDGMFDVEGVTTELRSVGKRTEQKAGNVDAVVSHSSEPAQKQDRIADGPVEQSDNQTSTSASNIDGVSTSNLDDVSDSKPDSRSASNLDSISETPPEQLDSQTSLVSSATTNGQVEEPYSITHGEESINKVNGIVAGDDQEKKQETKIEENVVNGDKATKEDQSIEAKANGNAKEEQTITDEAETKERRKEDEARAAAEAENKNLEQEEARAAADEAKRLEEEEQAKVAAEAEARRLGEEEQAKVAAEAKRLEQEEQARAEALRLQEEAAAARKRKAVLWNELKLLSISRYLTTLYAVNLLSILTNVQLSLLGRYSYLRSLDPQSSSSSSSGDDPLEAAWTRSSSISSSSKITQETEEAYLTFSWYFLHVGWKSLGERVQSKVEESCQGIPLKTEFNHAELFNLIKKIRRKIEYEYEYDEEEVERPAFMGAESLMADPPAGQDEMSSSMMSNSTTTSTLKSRQRRRRRRFNLLSYLLPSTPQGDLQVLQSAGIPTASQEDIVSISQIDPALSSLLDETRDIIESKDCLNVLKECLLSSFDESFSSLSSSFQLPLSNEQGSVNTIRELQSEEEEHLISAAGMGIKMKLASILLLFNQQSKLIIDSIPNHEIVQAVFAVKDLKAFSAIVYSAWTTGAE
ncbi:unnamed protein product [Sympodiomycopsis kandeliae]